MAGIYSGLYIKGGGSNYKILQAGVIKLAIYTYIHIYIYTYIGEITQYKGMVILEGFLLEMCIVWVGNTIIAWGPIG